MKAERHFLPGYIFLFRFVPPSAAPLNAQTTASCLCRSTEDFFSLVWCFTLYFCLVLFGMVSIFSTSNLFLLEAILARVEE